MNLKKVNFENADLRDVNFFGTNLKKAKLTTFTSEENKLKGFNFNDSNLEGAKFKYAVNVPFVPTACPTEGSFIGWKIVYKNFKIPYLIKLEILSDAKRSSATSNECRCNKAKVLNIIRMDNNEEIASIINYQYVYCLYKVGDIVYSDSFDENRWNICTHGIHFYMNKKDIFKAKYNICMDLL